MRRSTWGPGDGPQGICGPCAARPQPFPSCRQAAPGSGSQLSGASGSDFGLSQSQELRARPRVRAVRRSPPAGSLGHPAAPLPALLLASGRAQRVLEPTAQRRSLPQDPLLQADLTAPPVSSPCHRCPPNQAFGVFFPGDPEDTDGGSPSSHSLTFTEIPKDPRFGEQMARKRSGTSRAHVCVRAGKHGPFLSLVPIPSITCNWNPDAGRYGKLW